ncbi:protein lifeguard 3-like [Cheilinus undulatus]|uniref:protein lifeguard 3-like n=1 Tax=Cheilinus undulatus TaxID=241271 RepID=UPI001BD35B81|nr:protein lifeguard 3-like [Cheilinus undulatus]
MTSNTDNPPSYEAALHHPKHGNYPSCQPQHCSALPPPLSYSPSSGMCPVQPCYWGHGGIQPQDGMWEVLGLPPSRASNTIPTLSAGMLTSNPGDMEDYLSTLGESTSIRHAFIRKVYFILATQVAITCSVVAVFTFVDPVRLFVIRHPGIYWASLVVYILVYCILICGKKIRRQFPSNLLLLGIFTLALSFMSGTLSSYYETKSVFLAMGITAIICVSVTIFCFQTKVEFTSCRGFFCVLAVLLIIIGIVSAIILSLQYVPWLHMLYASFGAILYTLFLVYNTQLLIGNRELTVSPEEYINGALSLYINVVDIFLFILQVSGAVTG